MAPQAFATAEVFAMLRASRLRALHLLIAGGIVFGIGGGCFAIYDFDPIAPTSCTTASECPGSDRCGQRVCEKGECKLVNPVGENIIPFDEPRGNCQRVYCDGKGNEIVEADETDVPYDGDSCTDDICTNGVPSNPLSPEGTQCGTNASVTCSAAGLCQNCAIASDCGENTDCITWSCENTVCVKNLQLIGTEVENSVPGDCKKKLCDATGESPETFVADDAPSDGDPCTADYCTPNGEVVHDLLPAGTTCGDCFACTADGLCNPCDAATFDCYMGTCIPKPQLCTDGSECPSTYCVDGYCCDAECSSMCLACNSLKTGVPSGICGPVTNGTDPDGECNSLEPDVCMNGACQCQNGVQDGNETGVDCGGPCAACTGTWHCGDPGACDGNVPATCCAPVCSTCIDNSANCKAIVGQTCALGSAQQAFPLGTVAQSSCLNLVACKMAVCVCQ